MDIGLIPYRITTEWEDTSVMDYLRKNNIPHSLVCSSGKYSNNVTFIVEVQEQDILFLRLSQPNIIIKPDIKEEKVSKLKQVEVQN
mgnify:CR=1 FL=1